MVWVHAFPHTTEMIQRHPVRDRPDLLFVHGAMGVHRATFDANLSVSLVVAMPDANPARRDPPEILNGVVAFPKRGSALDTVGVAALETKRLVFDPSLVPIRLRSNPCALTAAALAES